MNCADDVTIDVHRSNGVGALTKSAKPGILYVVKEEILSRKNPSDVHHFDSKNGPRPGQIPGGRPANTLTITH